MELLHHALDLFLHLDQHLLALTQQYGLWVYLILFVIIFCETGLVVTPFLPGDSLLFAAGSLATLGALDVHGLFLLLTVAAVLGDTLNYAIGHTFGERAFTPDARFLKQAYLDKTHRFFERHGGKTIILARFVPIVRTFAPFVAGAGAMRYRQFLLYNVVGGLIWTSSLLYAGYFFGNLPVVQQHFSWVIVGIVIVSILPGVVAYLQERRAGA